LAAFRGKKTAFSNGEFPGGPFPKRGNARQSGGKSPQPKGGRKVQIKAPKWVFPVPTANSQTRAQTPGSKNGAPQGAQTLGSAGDPQWNGARKSKPNWFPASQESGFSFPRFRPTRVLMALQGEMPRNSAG